MPKQPQVSNQVLSHSTSLLNALSQLAVKDHKTIFAQVATPASLATNLSAGNYSSEDVLRIAQTRLGAITVVTSGQNVAIIPASVPLPLLSTVNPVAAKAIAELSQMNSVLNSLTPEQLYQWHNGNSEFALSSLTLEQQRRFLSYAQSRGKGMVINDETITQLTQSPMRWKVSIAFHVLLYIVEPDGTFHQATLSRTDRSQIYLPSKLPNLPGVQQPDPDVEPSITPSAPYKILAQDVNVHLLPKSDSMYSLHELSDTVSKQTHSDIVADHSVSSSQILIINPGSAMSANVLLQMMARVSGLSWRSVAGTAFLARSPLSLDTLAKVEAVKEATTENKRNLTFMFQQFPQYVYALNPSEFLQPARRWSSLSLHEQRILKGILFQSPDFLVDPKLGILLQNASDVSDITLKLNLVTSFTLSCDAGYQINKIFNLIPTD